MRCIDCKKEIKEINSRWDRIRLFLFHFFHTDIQDIKEESFTKGYGEGYEAGMKQGMSQKRLTLTPEQIISEVSKWHVPSKEYDIHKETTTESPVLDVGEIYTERPRKGRRGGKRSR